MGGYSRPTKSITFDAAGSKTVTSEESLSVSATQKWKVRTLMPNEMVSNEVSMTATCSGAMPDIDVTPTRLDFGNVTVGTSKRMDVRVTNRGTADLTFSISAITSPYIAEITCSEPLRPGENCWFNVQFRPPIATRYCYNGVNPGTDRYLLVTSNDPVKVELCGRGI